VTLLLPSAELAPADEPIPEEPEEGWFSRWWGRRRFNTPASEATPTFERAATHMRTGVIVVGTNEAGTARVAGRQPGRRSITLWVPSSVVVGGVFVTPAAGVLYSNTPGELQTFGGSVLNVGDAVTIPSETPVFVGLVPGQSIGFVQYMALFNPNG
jgi:hypothetical protein